MELPHNPNIDHSTSDKAKRAKAQENKKVSNLSGRKEVHSPVINVIHSVAENSFR
jgi:hypothetical protein